ncbi:hypothetical protein [Bacillus sonorensis]|uniref:hypothetical protein n=1 Tax=Bacillus sonorensis TaxID=119858 RepID=UPI000496A357|nr:hypothetical protein [Bacillus sonorensis]MCY8603356.1 hypothetical protein [Bacillus sonorensis]GIN66734.1 hypothetical protein J41TS2_21550 [Bacillus sonorensis]
MNLRIFFSYTLYSNGQIVRKYISGGEMKDELVSRIPESRVKKSDIEKAFDWVKARLKNYPVVMLVTER